MTAIADPRQAAADALNRLIVRLQAQPGTGPIVEECQALARAVGAFHLEGIRFRMYNVDRLLSKSGADVPAEAPAILEEVRRHLETAGFHTRSHQAPG